MTASAARDEADRRRERLAVLRAATRVLRRSGAAAEAAYGWDLRRIQREIAGLADAPEIAPSGAAASPREVEDGGALGRIDAGLDALAARLREAFDATPSAAVEAFPRRVESWRDGAIALLDVLLEDEGGLAGRCAAVAQLVTLLCIDEGDGGWRVRREPTTVAPRLRALAGDPAGFDVDAIERDFLEAAARCVEADLEESVREMAVRKAELGISLLDPSILQAAIFYDIAVRNASRERVEAPDGGSPRNPEKIPATPPAGERPLERPGNASPLPLPPPAKTWVPAPASPRSRPRSVVLIAVLGVATAAAFATWEGPGGSVHPLAEAELDALSPHLDFAYRNGSGSGPLFVGTLAEAWEDLSAAERDQSARRLSAVLRSGGVREMILYDAARRIAVHAADPLPLRIAPAARARATESPAPGAERSGQS